jgi:gluconokinase
VELSRERARVSQLVGAVDGGGLLRWLRESLNLETTDLESELASLSRLHGLTILPFWSGERSTGWSPDARGVILGLRQETQPMKSFAAIARGIAYRFALIARDLEAIRAGARIIATGNALRSRPRGCRSSRMCSAVRSHRKARRKRRSAGAALLALEAVGKIAVSKTFQFRRRRFSNRI